jgi:alpha-L-rhamnosidase
MKAARELGYTEDAAMFETLAEEVKAAIQAEYFTNTGRLAVDTQTAYVLALYFDIVPEKFRERTIEDLVHLLEKSNNHLATGFVGTAYLCNTLSGAGLGHLAYTLLLNEDYPSWLYAVNLGATTIWERWNSLLPDGTISGTGMNSFNHYAYGSIVEWMYRYMCGLNPSAPGFAEAEIAPLPDERIDSVSASYRSAAGLYRSAWVKTDDGYTFEITIPFNARAVFKAPGNPVEITVDGVAKDISSEIRLIAGDHRINVKYNT